MEGSNLAASRDYLVSKVTKSQIVCFVHKHILRWKLIAEVPRIRIATALPFKILQLHMQSYYFAYRKTIEASSIELSVYDVTSVQD